MNFNQITRYHTVRTLKVLQDELDKKDNSATLKAKLAHEMLCLLDVARVSQHDAWLRKSGASREREE